MLLGIILVPFCTSSNHEHATIAAAIDTPEEIEPRVALRTRRQARLEADSSHANPSTTELDNPGTNNKRLTTQKTRQIIYYLQCSIDKQAELTQNWETKLSVNRDKRA
ncbi:zinc knuckle domain protein [Penicillium frequentans]|nr:zinc knuckle domain protein [Penicillium glabrum]